LEEGKLLQILEAVRSAPSAGNLQAYDIVVVTEPTKKEALSRAALGQEFVAQAPVVLVFFANPERNAWRYGRRGEELYALQDATIAATYAMLSATALGLGSVWVGAFRDEEVRQVVGAPLHARPIALLPLGYPGERPSATLRRSLEDLVHWNEW